jgi:hypothetical protein
MEPTHETACSLGGNQNLKDLARGSILTSELMSPHGRDFGITLFVLEREREKGDVAKWHLLKP